MSNTDGTSWYWDQFSNWFNNVKYWCNPWFWEQFGDQYQIQMKPIISRPIWRPISNTGEFHDFEKKSTMLIIDET